MIPANAMLSGLDALPVGASSVLIDGFVKGALLLACSGLVVFVLRRASAAVRHLIWTIGLAGVLLMPALNGLLPDWFVRLPIRSIGRSTPAPDAVRVVITPESPSAAAAIAVMIGDEAKIVRVVPPVPPIASTPAPGSATAVALAVPPAPPAPPPAPPAPPPAPAPLPFAFNVDTIPQAAFDWRTIALAIWLGGAFIGLSGLLLSMLRVRAIQRRSQPITTGPCVDAVARAARRVGLENPPRVHIGDEHMMPMVFGLFSPVLLLPAGAGRWPLARLESVLLHELAHVRRRDALTQLIAELARAIYWFNPLVWFAARQVYLERELACDDIVLNAGTRPWDYAGDLLDLVRSLRSARATGMAAIAMARPSQMKVRLHAVLDDARSRVTADRRLVIGATVVALGVMLPLAAATPRTMDASPVNDSSELPLPMLAETPDLPMPGSALTPEAPVAIAGDGFSALYHSSDVQESCLDSNSRRSGTSISSHDDDNIMTVKWVQGRCSGHVRMEGKVRMSGDLTGVASISSGGLFQIDEDDGSIERKLTVRPVGARLDYDYRVDGRQREFAADGKEWLSKALLNLYRSTGFAADERVDYLLAQKGPQAVLDEVTVMRSDYTQRIYLQKLLNRTNLSPALVQQAIQTAAQDIDSDYELAELLIAYANKYTFNDQTRKAFIDATRTIGSDYEQRRVLATALGKGGLDSQDVTSMLEASQHISSDYERAELLIGLTSKYRMDSAMRTAYLTAAKDIGSDYEKRRVYDNLLKQGAMSPADLTNVLRYAGTIGSDYEKAELLIGLSKFDLADATLQSAYVTAASSISSDYELRRALSTLVQKDRLTASNLDLVLKSALNISSDYELSELLLLVASRNDITGPQREAFMKALNSINSSYEYGRVATALLKKGN